MKLVLASYTLWNREVVRFLRQKNRVIGALMQPILFWLLIGSGMNASFQPQKVSYIEYFFPGVILMIILFTSIFSTITIIQDRKEGFMQGVLVAPVPRSAIVLGKVMGGVTLSLIQALLFLCFLFTPLIQLQLTWLSFIYLVLAISFVSFGITCLGVMIAWPMDSIQGYHAIMSVFLFPLWIFSGAAFPLEGAPTWLAFIMKINPLTYGLRLIRECFYHSNEPISVTLAIAGVAGFCFVTFAMALWLVRRR